MIRAKFVVLGVLLAAAPALAQDAPPPPPPPTSGGSATASTGAAPTDWGQIDTRPLVLPTGKFEVHASLPIFATSFTDPTTMMTSTQTSEALALGATYGIADKAQVGLEYAFPLNPNGDPSNGFIGLHGAYAAMHSDKMDLAVSGEFLIGLGGNNDLGLQLGGWLRYHVAPKISIFTGQPPVPFALAGLGVAYLAAPTAYQFAIGLNNNQATTLSLPVGVGFQATPQIWAFAETQIAEFYLSNGPANSSGFFIFSDFIPLGIGGWYSASDKMDLGVVFADDLKNAGDLYTITFAGRYYIK